MTDKEKARAYDEALERAKKYNIDDAHAYQGTIVKLIFPELRESKDERIRKWIFDLVNNMSFENLTESERAKNEEWREKVLDYLEKQKELDKMIVVSPEVWDNAISDAYENGKKDGEKQKENPEEPKIAFGDWGDKEKQEAIFTCLKYMRFIKKITNQEYDDLTKWLNDNLTEKQKEQKPADLSKMMVHKEPDVVPVPTPMVADEQKPVDYEAELKKCKDNPLYFFDKYVSIKLKPMKWSEEDEAFLKVAIAVCNRYSHKNIADWLKSLRPQYHGDVTMTEAYKMGKEAGEASHWKPSEEQMNALQVAAMVSKTDFNTLTSLLVDLKKL